MTTDELKAAFGHRLVSIRTERRITQEILAERCGVHVDTISLIERGIHGPRFDLLAKLAVELAVEPRELFEFDS